MSLSHTMTKTLLPTPRNNSENFSTDTTFSWFITTCCMFSTITKIAISELDFDFMGKKQTKTQIKAMVLQKYSSGPKLIHIASRKQGEQFFPPTNPHVDNCD